MRKNSHAFPMVELFSYWSSIVQEKIEIPFIVTIRRHYKIRWQKVKMKNKYTLFYKQHFYKQHQAETGKKNGRYSKKRAKNKCVCLNEIIWLIIKKIRLKMKNGSHGCDIYLCYLALDIETNILNIKCVSV